ncbi:MAG: hypothetical protein CSA22_01240 [Deltaproteobacteria bacterium]|nr:MAG: hypothetical protein CSA22_01240 [Deltaproteobacteria bacterium]
MAINERFQGQCAEDSPPLLRAAKRSGQRELPDDTGRCDANPAASRRDVDAVRRLVPVTVIIPCYRCRDVIERALASVAAQTVLPEKVILVDDACPDTPVSFWQALAIRWPELHIHTRHLKENRGPADARNAGWDVANTAYIAFLDADDAWHPEKLAMQYQWMSTHPWTHFSGHRRRSADRHISVSRSGWTEPCLLKLLLTNVFSTSTVMIRRNVPFRFEPGQRYAEDYRLWLQLIASGYRGVFLAAPISYRFKKAYGESGLSLRLWAMERGELAGFYHLLNSGKIGLPEWVFASVFSLLKFVKRLMVSAQR